MKREVFNYPPSIEVLKMLTPGSLKQNLGKAVRLWVILRSLYGDDVDELKLELKEEFTFIQWRNLFFLDAERQHSRDKVPILHTQECRCATKLTDWLFASSLNIDKNKWCQSFSEYYSIQSHELENLLLTGTITNSSENDQRSRRFSKSLLDGRLFSVTSRNLKEYDFGSLVTLGWLQKISNHRTENQEEYLKVDNFPEFFLTRFQEIQITSEQFTNEELSAFNNSLSQPINGIQRFFIHAEYIVHPKLYEQVELLQKQLKNIWAQDQVPLVRLTYQSAKLYQENVDCIVYPVCIYYYQRAPYLFGYGQTPKQDNEDSWSEINWYDYRLDRIIKFDELQPDIDYTNIPEHFVNKCQGKYPPSPNDIKNKMSDAWGFDIHKPQELLVLRFNQYFYSYYIAGTERDEMFKKISVQQVEKLIKYKYYRFTELGKQKYLLSTIESRSEKDIYCQVNYRVNDNNIVMRLRAWGPNVEVILPWDLRQRMTTDIDAIYKLYK